MIALQGLEIGEKQLWKYEETHIFGFFPVLYIIDLMSYLYFPPGGSIN